MRVSVCGHATLLVESSDQVILVDPVLTPGLAGGAVTFNPQRRFDLHRMPSPTIMVVTHGHFDHFHQESLSLVSRDIVVVAPSDPELLPELKAAGFRDIRIIEPWQTVTFGRTAIMGTPSSYDEPELGILIRDGDAVFWHMADGEVSPEHGKRVLAEAGAIDIIACKYQPVVVGSMSYLRGGSSNFSGTEVCDWLEAACVTRPRFIFPYASGLSFDGHHAWFNRYAFPLTAEEAVGLIRRRLGDDTVAEVAKPGDVIEAHGGVVRHLVDAAVFVDAMPSPAPVRWEPVDTSTLIGLDSGGERQELRARLHEILTGAMGRWLGPELQNPESMFRDFLHWGVLWELVVHAGAGERIVYSIDFRDPANIGFGEGAHPEANFYTHIAGRTLLRVLRGEADPILFWLTGEARSFEKVVTVRNGRFSRPEFPAEPQKRPIDPLTFFLRQHWSAPQPALASQA